MRISYLMFAVALVASTPANAQFSNIPGSFGPPHIDPIALKTIYVGRLQTLRNEALRKQAEDGGKLRPESLAALQVKLDRINKSYARDVRKNDSFSVDANGAPVSN